MTKIVVLAVAEVSSHESAPSTSTSISAGGTGEDADGVVAEIAVEF